MELWGWLVGYVVLFALFHLLLYYFYARRGDDGPPQPSFVDGNGTGARYAPQSDGGSRSREDPDIDRDPEVEGETMRCPHCGTVNERDPVYTYCWNCVSSLGR